MLKSQLGFSEVFKVLAIVRSILRFTLKEWDGDGLSWKDVQKYLKSKEFEDLVIEVIGGFGVVPGGAKDQNSELDIAKVALKASEKALQDLTAKDAARLAAPA